MTGLNEILNLQREFGLESITFDLLKDAFSEYVEITVKTKTHYVKARIDGKVIKFGKGDYLRHTIEDMMHQLVSDIVDPPEGPKE